MPVLDVLAEDEGVDKERVLFTMLSHFPYNWTTEDSAVIERLDV